MAAFLVLSSGIAMAEDKKEVSTEGLESQQQDRVTGRQLMTRQEHEEFRNKMRSASSAEERQRIQKEHHERMKARAKERGLSIPEDPRADGMGRGMGKGMGGGGGRR